VGLDDAEGLRRALDGVKLVFHAAGPFVDTSEAMIRACLDASVSYVDITGEIPVFQTSFKYDAVAKQKNVVLMSGVGFDVVPTDCLARHVADQVEHASELEIAIAVIGQPSGGTSKSSFDAMLRGGFWRRGGELTPLAFGKGVRSVRFSDAERPVMPIPWGDLETAYRSTGIPNITTYMAVPPRVAAALSKGWPLAAAGMPVLRALLGTSPIKRAIQRSIGTRIKGPDEQARRAGHSYMWARAAASDGRAAEAWLETLEGYDFTALAGVRIVERLLAQPLRGALTPAQAFGADFVLEIEGTKRYDRLPTPA
jgi:short subunit dehydrogenase-like uncharacterized protein